MKLPSYSFRCTACGLEMVKRYTAIPSEDKRSVAVCQDCGAKAERDYGADIESVQVTGGQKQGVEDSMKFGLEKDASGRPFYRDANGRTREVTGAKDVDRFTRDNMLGKPRLVEFRNPITGRKSWEPLRQGGLRPHPVTGEPMELTPIVREPAKMVNMGEIKGEFQIPSHTQTGIPLKNGVRPQIANDQKKLGLIDPETGKRMTMADCWSDTEKGVNIGRVEVKHPPSGMKWK